MQLVNIIIDSFLDVVERVLHQETHLSPEEVERVILVIKSYLG